MANTGRTNLLEEVGRIDAEKSNPNRRAEKRRVIGELNKGYKKGGRVGYKHGSWKKVPTPHADIAKYVEKDSSKSPEHFRKEGSTMKVTKSRRSAGPSGSRSARPKGGWTS